VQRAGSSHDRRLLAGGTVEIAAQLGGHALVAAQREHAEEHGVRLREAPRPPRAGQARLGARARRGDLRRRAAPGLALDRSGRVDADEQRP